MIRPLIGKYIIYIMGIWTVEGTLTQNIYHYSIVIIFLLLPLHSGPLCVASSALETRLIWLLFSIYLRCSYFFTQKQRLKAHRSRYSDKFLTHKLQYFSTKNALVVHIEGTCLYNILMQHCDPKFSKATLPWMFFGLCTQNLGGNTEYWA